LDPYGSALVWLPGSGSELVWLPGSGSALKYKAGSGSALKPMRIHNTGTQKEVICSGKKNELVSHQISEIGGKQPWPVMNSIISLGKLVPSPDRLSKKEIDCQ
jgi:hypothetical protein